MPELPEVQAVVNSLLPHLPGRRILTVIQHRADIACLHKFSRRSKGIDLAELLTGRTVRSLFRRGKRIVFELDDKAHFYVHLGMTGHLAWAATVAKAKRPHTHLVLNLSGVDGHDPGDLSFSDPRRFGRVVYLPPGLPPDADLGPEPFDLAPEDLHARLRRTRRPIKAALLDQTLLAGLGNIYADESLHAARIHPRRRTHTLRRADVENLLAAIRRTLSAAIAAGGSTLRDYRDAAGNPGRYVEQHAVYGRRGRPCPTCSSPIRTIAVAQRSTHFCPVCQPAQPRRRGRQNG